MKIIPYGLHHISKQDLTSVKNSLKSNLITGGQYVKKFEKKIKYFLKSKFVLTTSSGTSALHLAFMSIGLRKNDIVLMPSVNFVASFNIAKSLGAKIYLVDVDIYTGQITPENIIDCIKKNKIKKIKCLVSVFLGGYPENIYNFYKLKKEYNFYIIEDACHAFGSKYIHNKKFINIGSNLHSDISVFSFHPVKSIATGEGGCLTTKSKKIYNFSNLIRNHGILRGKNHWDYDIINNGYNFRLSDINCSLGLSQLNNLEKFLTRRKKIAEYYNKKLPIMVPFVSVPNYNEKNINSYHLYLININFKKLKKNKNAFLRYMLKKNVYCQIHYKPLYKFKIYKNKKNLIKKFKNTERYYANTLSLPIYYDLSKRQQDYIINSIKKFFHVQK